MNHTKRIADALEHFVIGAAKVIASHDGCALCALLKPQPAKKMKPSIVRTDKELKGMENDIRTRRALANSPEEPEAESDSFRYREAEKWKH